MPVRWHTIRQVSKRFQKDVETSGLHEEVIPMGLIPNFYEMKETAEEALDLLRRAVSALEKLATEQERANHLFAEANEDSLAPLPKVAEL